VTTVAGTTQVGGGPGDGDCTAGCDLDTLQGGLNHPFDIALDPVAPDTLWVFDDHRISRVDLAARELFTELGGLGSAGGVVVDTDGIVYVSDPQSAVIWRVEGDVVTILAGQEGVPGNSGDGGPATSALLGGGDLASKIALDGRRLLLADGPNHVVRAIDLDAGTIELVAGSTEGEPFVTPTDVAVGADDSIYVADPGSHCVFVIHPDGTVASFAGVCATSGFAGDGGPATAALFSEPYGVAVDAAGAVYVADTMNQVIRRVAP
jgi:sugar lactone lactonase YvrE